MTATNTTAASSQRLHGIMVALITPFTDDGKCISAPRLKSHIDHLISSGVHGLVPGGSTGEFTTLSRSERKQLTELCVEYAAGRVPVVAGTGSTSTEEAIDLAVHAAQAGAAAVMVVPPFYDPLSYAQLTELMSEIHTASGLHIVYYNIPSASGLTLTPQQLADLSQHGVKYLKDTSGNAPAYTELVFGLNDKITAFNGWDTLTFYGLAAGSEGAVWGASNIIPELSVELWNAVVVEKDLDKGRALWRKAWPICKFLESHNYAAAVKTGVELRGQKTGGLRKPFALLEGELREELARLIEAAGVKVVR
ncbi:dihydrodipicolinate synthase family protein [Aspergillus saccharolyticus JOP 1030-1]|uniref:Dihydrodipicolinate synthase n=1 Tax=Aspergillus saccharolyticus JOP 1030-1 TaxID=1450539 RepID=A0A318Z9P3_9EURO|nr:dihydrodipicolinate synthase [Aspergillus saccharolyticus JOP 1030-1]PYH44076.1 dihydrodipicolinate synthase [Aspergillus saccharolyticus JOP 1030-1]